MKEFAELAAQIHIAHRSQTLDDVLHLNLKYQQPVFGKKNIWDVLLMLKSVVDPTDKVLYQATQWDHIKQVIAMMERDGITSEEMYISALVHDLGKVLILAGGRTRKCRV